LLSFCSPFVLSFCAARRICKRKVNAFGFFTLFRITKMRTLHFVDKNDKAALVNDKNDNTNGVLGQNLPHQVSYSRFPFILTF